MHPECNLVYPAVLRLRSCHLLLQGRVIGSECHNMRKQRQGRTVCVLTSRGCQKGNPAVEVCSYEKGYIKGKLGTVIRGILKFCMVRRAPALL